VSEHEAAAQPAGHAGPPARSALAAATERVLNRGGRSNPDVLLVRHAGGLVVVKDFAPRGRFVRRWLGPWLCARELRAWRALEGHPAVPRLIGAVDRLAFAVEYRPGETLFSGRLQPVPEGFLAQLEEAVAEMHRRGVVHLDLRNRTNVLRDENGRPVLIDFGSALVFRPRGFLARWLLPPLAAFDRRALRKWRTKQRRRKRLLGA
jgi:predicted Ser/Thr protein kinase